MIISISFNLTKNKQQQNKFKDQALFYKRTQDKLSHLFRMYEKEPLASIRAWTRMNRR